MNHARQTARSDRREKRGESLMIDHDSITYGDAIIDYEVRRSKRRTKTIEVKVGQEGVLVYAPWAAPDEALRSFVNEKARWILKHLNKLEAIQPLRFVDGETIPYLGREILCCFELSAISSPEVHLDQQCFRVFEPPGLEGETRIELIGRAFLGWYHARAMELIPAAVDHWWPVLGHGPKSRVLIRDQRTRWASCGIDGTLRFNWRVITLDPALLDYVVVHELAHLRVRGHSRDFWNVVRQVLPDVDQRRKRLKEVGFGIQQRLPMI